MPRKEEAEAARSAGEAVRKACKEEVRTEGEVVRKEEEART